MAKPNSLQTNWIKRIAQEGPLVKTYVEKRGGGRETQYALQNGGPVTAAVAERLIRSGMLVPQKDGMWDDCQTWRAKTPTDG